MVLVAQPEQQLHDAIVAATALGNYDVAWSTYVRSNPLSLRSARTHHAAAVAARKLHDRSGFEMAFDYASQCSMDRDVVANFMRDRALMIIVEQRWRWSQQRRRANYEQAMQEMRVASDFRQDVVQAIVDRIAYAKIQLASGHPDEAVRWIQEACDAVYSLPQPEIQLVRNVNWWMLCVSARTNGQRFNQLYRNVTVGIATPRGLAVEIKPQRIIAAKLLHRAGRLRQPVAALLLWLDR